MKTGDLTFVLPKLGFDMALWDDNGPLATVIGRMRKKDTAVVLGRACDDTRKPPWDDQTLVLTNGTVGWVPTIDLDVVAR